MQPIDLITDEDFDTYKEWASTANEAGYVKGTKEDIFKAWNEAKAQLFKMLGNHLVISKTVDVPIDSDEMFERREKIFKSDEFTEVARRLRDCLVGACFDPITGANKLSTEDFKKICRAATKEDLISDSLTYSYKISINGKTTSAKVGSSPIRALRRFFKSVGYEDKKSEPYLILDQIGQLFSKANNDSVNKEELCLSIAPIDFVSSSDNDCNWTSCMNWLDKGGYRAGTIEMMNSPIVLTAYVKAKDPFYFGNNDEYELPNKKWRAFVVVHDDIVTPVKGYPYQNKALEKIIIDWIKELLIKNCGASDEPSSFVEETRQKRTVSDSVIINSHTNMMYDDFGASGTHLCYLRKYDPEKDNKKVISLNNYSGKLTCSCCGQEYDYGKNACAEDVLVCPDCLGSDYNICSSCGCLIRPDDSVYYGYDGEPYCESCASDATFDIFYECYTNINDSRVAIDFKDSRDYDHVVYLDNAHFENGEYNDYFDLSCAQSTGDDEDDDSGADYIVPFEAITSRGRDALSAYISGWFSRRW